jgi:hypothetical protein
VSSKPTSTSGGLKVKPSTPEARESKPETQARSGLEKASNLKEVLEKPNSKLTYAVVRARRNVIVSIVNKNGFLRINIVTMTPQRPISGFDARLLGRVIRALNDLYNDLTALKPNLNQGKSNVREY